MGIIKVRIEHFKRGRKFQARFQKNPRVRKIRVHNSGAGNGCANFMDTWRKCVLSAGKPMSIKFLVLGGGVFWVWGGGSADFIFTGARIFLKIETFKERIQIFKRMDCGKSVGGRVWELMRSVSWDLLAIVDE